MPNASELMQRHLDTLVDDPETWLSLIADDMVWELPFAPSLGYPDKLEGRTQIAGFVGAFFKAFENLRFHDIRTSALADGVGAVAETRATARIPATGRDYQQSYVIFLEARDGKIARLREYFNPAKAAVAFDVPLAEVAVAQRS